MKFIVKVIDSEGANHEHTLDLPGRDDVLRHCRSERWTVLELRSSEPAARRPEARRGWEPFGIRPAALAFFTRQLAELTECGIPLVQTLETMKRFSSSGRLQDVASAIIRDISAGKSFSQALKAHPQVFSKIYVSTVEVGEKTGDLAMLLGRMADYMEQEEAVRAKLRSGLSYPFFILGFSLLLTYCMVTFLLPAFTPLFKQSGLNLNNYPITMALITLSNLCTNIWDELVVALSLGCLAYIYHRVVNTPVGKLARDRLLFHLPVVGEFVQLAAYARVCQTLGLLQNSGVPIYQAVSIAADSAGNEVVSQALLEARQQLEGGKALSVALGSREDDFPPLMIQMIAVGEQSGDVPKMLTRMARYYEGQLESSIKGFSALIEPITTVLIGLIVGLFVIGIFSPIMGIVGALQART